MLQKTKMFIYAFFRRNGVGNTTTPKFPETDIPRTERIFSADFPICIPSLGAKRSIVKFEIDSAEAFPSDLNNIRLQIATNNKIKESTYTCKDSKYDMTYM